MGLACILLKLALYSAQWSLSNHVTHVTAKISSDINIAY